MNPPKPTELRILAGNPGHRPLPENEPKPELGAEMPDFLSAAAQEHWPKIARQLESVGVLTRMDAVALALYCETFARWKHANDQVFRFGTVIKSPNGYPMQSPWLQISNKAHEQMVRLLVEFGMTPSSRTRLKSSDTQGTKKSRLRNVLDFG